MQFLKFLFFVVAAAVGEQSIVPSTGRSSPAAPVRPSVEVIVLLTAVRSTLTRINDKTCCVSAPFLHASLVFSGPALPV